MYISGGGRSQENQTNCDAHHLANMPPRFEFILSVRSIQFWNSFISIPNNWTQLTFAVDLEIYQVKNDNPSWPLFFAYFDTSFLIFSFKNSSFLYKLIMS